MGLSRLVQRRRYVVRIPGHRLTSISVLLSLLVCIAPANTPSSSNHDQASQKTGLREPVKRALLIGIGLYQPQKADQQPKEQGVVKVETSNRQPPSAARGGGRAALSNLEGPKTDVAAMREVLSKKYGFTVIDTLEDQKASRAAILAAIKKDLVDDSAPGDVCVFYYSGHGSRVRNSKGGEADGYDESMVPADSNQGALDIRDKELARLFLDALKKGVILTTIFDSCHSGSIGRGYPV